MNYRKRLGIDFGDVNPDVSREEKVKYINFKLAALGLPVFDDASFGDSGYFIDLFEDIIKNFKEKNRLIDVNEIGINKRINQFFAEYFKDSNDQIKVVQQAFVLDHYGLAREMSLAPNKDEFHNDYVTSYRIKQGVLNNPKSDRRTTEGSFHIVEGGLAIPDDKKAVPKQTFVKLYQAALTPPDDLMELPFTSSQGEKAKTFVSLTIKPCVSPEVPGVLKEKAMEIQMVAPGSLVSNLDFIESVFGNSGDPSLHSKDSGLDLEGWSGHTGYVILAPHLPQLRKIDVGLPHYDQATERQRRDQMCYKNEDELYNNGQAFKLTCRNTSGVAVTIIADNYYGYSKKEVKTLISFASNLYGNVEEEHAGGTVAYTRLNVGESYKGKDNKTLEGRTFEEVKELYQDLMYLMPDNYGIDKNYKNIIYLPENIEFDLHETVVKWEYQNEVKKLKLLPSNVYILPNGDKLNLEKHPATPTWKLVITEAEGVFCHKPCTVSGGGKSEISKSISNSVIYGNYYVHDLEKDLDFVQQILDYDYTNRWKTGPEHEGKSRAILSPNRSLGSTIKLLTPSEKYSDEYNQFLKAFPNYVKALVLMVKRFYKASWGADWRSHFTVDILDGNPGHEIKYDGRKIRPSYLRVGFSDDEAWRVFKLRMDFMPSEKIQKEDDISSSVLLPKELLHDLNPEYKNGSYKFAKNCEYRFFQRPDDAIHKGYDLQAEKDLSSDNLFITNFQPLTKEDVQLIKDDVMSYTAYTEPVKKHIDEFLKSDFKYCVVSSESRIVDGKPTKNPRYLETRADFSNPIQTYIANIGTHFARKVPMNQAILEPVNAMLPGRRNNPPSLENGKKVLPLSVYSPIHYQELPELFMDYFSSLTGKSPSTTGAGSEGALTKAPFNMLLPIYDMNNALLSYILGDYHAFTTPAGHIGPNIRVDHDISMLIPELWVRLTEEERNPQKLIEEGSLEKIDDFEYEGELIPASRLGYRITESFCQGYLGKIFDEPEKVFDEGILRPEKQSLEAFADGVKNIASGHKKVAEAYMRDGSIHEAIPPLKALLYIMAEGTYEGHTINSKEVRDLFKREHVISSVWYQERLENKRKIEVKLLKKKIAYVEAFMANPVNNTIIQEMQYETKLAEAKKELEYLNTEEYLKTQVGTLGAEKVAAQI
jgi:phosphoenolpyruvate carboxykinase (diphosphate)